MSVRRPPYAITGGLKVSVEAELHQLLLRARRGELVGFAWVAITDRAGRLDAGAAGSLGRDPIRAAGALHRAVDAALRTE